MARNPHLTDAHKEWACRQFAKGASPVKTAQDMLVEFPELIGFDKRDLTSKIANLRLAKKWHKIICAMEEEGLDVPTANVAELDLTNPKERLRLIQSQIQKMKSHNQMDLNTLLKYMQEAAKEADRIKDHKENKPITYADFVRKVVDTAEKYRVFGTKRKVVVFDE